MSTLLTTHTLRGYKGTRILETTRLLLCDHVVDTSTVLRRGSTVSVVILLSGEMKVLTGTSHSFGNNNPLQIYLDLPF